jgi:hypothetical protein
MKNEKLRPSGWRHKLGVIFFILHSAFFIVLLSADVPRFTVRLFFDRVRPDDSLRIVDFRLAETAGEPAATHFRLRAKEGTFHVSFELVGQIEFLRFLEAVDEVVRYEARVSFRNGRSPRVGVLELRVLEGTAEGMAWHHLLVTQPDRGARLFKIVFQDNATP